MTRLHELFQDQGQSPWLDNIQRGWITSGELARWVDDGVRGLTSNPSIFQKAIAGSDAYDDEFRGAIGDGLSIEDSYWNLVTSDIEAALAILRPVYDRSEGLDGYVSVEVDPGLARETAATERAARELWDSIGEPNLYVKIPGTAEGLPADLHPVLRRVYAARRVRSDHLNPSLAALIPVSEFAGAAAGAARLVAARERGERKAVG